MNFRQARSSPKTRDFSAKTFPNPASMVEHFVEARCGKAADQRHGSGGRGDLPNGWGNHFTFRRCVMCARKSIGCWLVLTLLALPGFVGCQPPADYSAMKDKIDELSKNVKALSDETREAAKGWATQKDLDAVRDRVVANERASFEQAEKLRVALEAANERLARAGASTAQIASLKERLDKAESDLKFNLEAVNEQRSILGEIATQDHEGRWIPAIGNAADNGQFREEFRDAVRDALPSVLPQLGRVRIENRMPNLQHIEVNGMDHWVGPGSTLDVIVPAGSATTRLVDYEGQKKWRLDAGNNYSQTVIIDRQPSYNAVVWYR
jgi:hypothetical protein